MSSRQYSRGNGIIAGVIATGALAAAGLNGIGGDTAGTLVFGMLALLLGLQAGDELSWQGSQDSVVKPLSVVVLVILVAALAWQVVTWLAGD